VLACSTYFICLLQNEFDRQMDSVVVTEETTHVHIGLFFLFLLLLGLLVGGGGLGGGGSGGTTSGGGGGTSVLKHVSDVLSLEGLGEKAGPVAFDRVSASSDDLFQFLFRDLKLAVVEHKSSVGANKFVFLLLGEG